MKIKKSFKFGDINPKWPVKHKNIIFSFGIVICFLFSSLLMINDFSTANVEKNGNPEIEYLNIETIIDNNYAITEIKELFSNPNDFPVDQTFAFQIPDGAFISNFSLKINNKTYFAKIVPKDKGIQKYEEAVVNGSNAGLVEDKGKNIFSFSVSLSPNQKILITLKYEEFLGKSLGGYKYIIPFENGNIDSDINKFSIDINMKSKLNIIDVDIENYRDPKLISWTNTNEVNVKYKSNGSVPKKDFIVVYEINSPPMNGTLLNYDDGESKYFFHIFSPQRSDLGGRAMDKEIIFVLDKSGSMSGQKISQLKTAFEEIINQLPGEDSLNIVMFDSSIKKYKNKLFTANDDNKNDAVEYINDIKAGGSTNINQALTTALEMFEISETKVPIIVMLTDGLPTAGVTNPTVIRENILEANSADVAIFNLGFGFDVDFDFLKAMSLENFGIAIRIYEGEDAGEQITNFYDTISTPLLKGLLISYSNTTYEYYPKKVDQLFEGSEVVVVGKYNGTSAVISSSIEATSWEGMKSFNEEFLMQEDTNFSFIPRFWAYAKIKHLLNELAIQGQNKSIEENITDLALDYGFVTPFTSLLVEMSDEYVEKSEEEEKKDDKQTLILPDIDNDGINYSGKPNSRPPSCDGDDKECEENDSLGMASLDTFPCFIIFLIIIILVVLGIILVLKRKKKKSRKFLN